MSFNATFFVELIGSTVLHLSFVFIYCNGTLPSAT